MKLVILTGASGAGKTTIAQAFGERFPDDASVFRFDSIGVPSTERMIEDHGSPEGWQRAKALEWLTRLARIDGNVLFEGQVRIAFLKEAAAMAGLSAHMIVLVDCDDETRRRRLALERLQPELATPAMFDWARFLRAEAERGAHPILDTSALSLDECILWVRRRFST